MSRLGRGTAIVVIDMVGDMFAREELAAQRERLVRSIDALTGAAREAGSPVVWIGLEYEEDLSDAPLYYRRHGIRSTIAGTDGARLLPELHPAPDDQVIIKKRYSGFFGTDLDDRLRRDRIDHLVVAGVNTHACVRSTAIDAYQRDYDVTIVEDCVGSYDAEHHDVSLRYMAGRIAEVVSLQELLAAGGPA
jgi:nicotinamidase-related amidase